MQYINIIFVCNRGMQGCSLCLLGNQLKFQLQPFGGKRACARTYYVITIVGTLVRFEVGQCHFWRMNSMLEAYCTAKQSELGSCQSNLCLSWGFERLQKSKDSLTACFENENIIDEVTTALGMRQSQQKSSAFLVC